METLAQIQQEVKEVIIEALQMEDVSPADIQNDESFFGTEEEPGIIQDSLAILEIASRLSERYEIMPSEFNQDCFQNVNTLSDMIHSHVGEEVAELVE